MRVKRMEKAIYVTLNANEVKSGCEVMKVKDGDKVDGFRLTLAKARELLEKLEREVYG